MTKIFKKIAVYKIRVAIRLGNPWVFSRSRRAARTTWWSMRRTMPCWPTLGCPRCRWTRCFCWRARNNSSWNLKKNCDSMFIDYISCIYIYMYTLYIQYIHHNIYICLWNIYNLYHISNIPSFFGTSMSNILSTSHASALLQEGVGQRGTKSFCGSVAFLAPEILHRKGTTWVIMM